MTGYDVYKKAMARLGYNNSADETFSNDSMLESAKECINQISADLRLTPINELSQEVSCSENKAEALCCGVVMMLALNEGDGEKNRLFAEIYNGKRAAALSETGLIEDKLPIAESEV